MTWPTWVRRLFQKAAVTPLSSADIPSIAAPLSGRSWWPLVRESFAGAWQRSVVVDTASIITYGTVWACITLIASDIAKLWIDLVEIGADGIRTPTTSTAFSPVLRKPNHFQTRIKFFEYWVICKLVYGNTYVLKERDGRGIVVALYVLDASRVKVLLSPNGDVYYQLAADTLAGITANSVIVPASEIIHDVGVPMYHPLCGVSPITACGLAATQGLKIQNNSAKLFASGSNLTGILTAPASISPETAEKIEKHWEEYYGGENNIGKVAALGDGLKFEPMTMTAMDAQLIDQLKWTSETICATFHVPGYMVGIGPAPPYTDIESINLQYYSQALQNPIENIEVLLEEGLEVPSKYGIEFDLDALARMNTAGRMTTAKEGVLGGIYSPNEARARFDLRAVAGGESPYLQQQMWPLKQLADRPTPAPPAIPGPPTPAADDTAKEQAAILHFTARAKALGLPVQEEQAA